MPVITANSKNRPWVHQEIGFALGIGVPVIPLVIDELPEQMIATTQNLSIAGDLSGIAHKLQKIDFEAIVASKPEITRLRVSAEVADFSEERTSLFISQTESIREPCRIRQRAIFSSFSLPDSGASDPKWKVIELNHPRSEYYRTLLTNERSILLHHARVGGCSLIISPFLDFTPVGPEVHRTQLETLLDFLRSMPSDRITVGIPESPFAGGLTVVGDWLSVETLPPQPGSEYRMTVFMRHAPKVLDCIRKFDEELSRILNASGVPAGESRDLAISRIKDRLRSLPNP